MRNPQRENKPWVEKYAAGRAAHRTLTEFVAPGLAGVLPKNKALQPDPDKPELSLGDTFKARISLAIRNIWQTFSRSQQPLIVSIIYDFTVALGRGDWLTLPTWRTISAGRDGSSRHAMDAWTAGKKDPLMSNSGDERPKGNNSGEIRRREERVDGRSFSESEVARDVSRVKDSNMPSIIPRRIVELILGPVELGAQFMNPLSDSESEPAEDINRWRMLQPSRRSSSGYWSTLTGRLCPAEAA